MIKEEEKAREYFQELKETFQLFQSHVWKTEFKKFVDKFINRQLKEARYPMAAPCRDESHEEEASVCLHGVRRLVAGAVQEWELVQQPEYAATCAEIDGALVWHGRGYVIPARLLSLHLNRLPRVHLKKFRQQYGW